MTKIYIAINVSALALSVIFLVLIILIGIIKVMVYLVPYKEDPSPPETGAPATPNIPVEELTAAIHAAMAAHLGKSPNEIQIGAVRPL